LKDIHVIRTGLLAVNSLIVPISSGNSSDERKVFVVDPATSVFSKDENVIV